MIPGIRVAPTHTAQGVPLSPTVHDEGGTILVTGGCGKRPLGEGGGRDRRLSLAQASVGMEGPVAFGDGLHLFPQLGLEGLLPGTLFPDARHGVFGKGDLVATCCCSNLRQCRRHDATAGPHGPYPDAAQDLDGELHLDVAHEVGRFDGGMGRDGILCGTPPKPAGSLRPPPGECAGDGLAQVMKPLLDAPARVEVGPAGPGVVDVDAQLGRTAFAIAGRPLVCQHDRYGFGLPREVEQGRGRDVGQQRPGNPETPRYK